MSSSAAVVWKVQLLALLFSLSLSWNLLFQESLRIRLIEHAEVRNFANRRCTRRSPDVTVVWLLFVLSCVANSAWLILFHYEPFLLTIVAIVTLLLLLIAICLCLDIGNSVVPRAARWLINI